MLTFPKSRFPTGHSEGSLNDSDPQDAPGEILGDFWSAQTIPPLFEGKIIDFENIPQPNGWERFQFFGADAWGKRVSWFSVEGVSDLGGRYLISGSSPYSPNIAWFYFFVWIVLEVRQPSFFGETLKLHKNTYVW